MTITGYQWHTQEGGAISGATAATYTPDAAQIDTANLYCTLTLSDASTLDTPAYVVRDAPPVAGTLAPVNETQGTGTPTVNLAAGFTGLRLVY
ncbi:MAG: hypothetical protein ACPG61_16695, partial [Paracoccaceae bacterium]